MNYKLACSTWDETELEEIEKVISSGKFSMGERVREYEMTFAQKVGAKYAVMVNSGSSANLALLSAARYLKTPLFQPGDEIIVPAVSWSTTYFPVHQLGAKLKFVDINKNSLNLDVESALEAVSSNTKAIFGVNLLGNPMEWSAIREIANEKGLVLFEDNCESLGATLEGRSTGTFGIGGTFSFFFSHHISTMEGGMVVTDDEALWHTMLSIRAHGWTRELPTMNHVHNKTGDSWDDFYKFVLPGYNLRPLELEAAIGLVQIKKLDRFVSVRRLNASRFLQIAESFPEIRTQRENGNSSWFGFSLVLQERLKGRRRELVKWLKKHNIESRPIVAGNFTKNPVVKHLNCSPIGNLEVSDEIHDQGLFIGNHHFNLSHEIDYFFEVLEEFRRSF